MSSDEHTSIRQHDDLVNARSNDPFVTKGKIDVSASGQLNGQFSVAGRRRPLVIADDDRILPFIREARVRDGKLIVGRAGNRRAAMAFTTSTLFSPMAWCRRDRCCRSMAES